MKTAVYTKYCSPGNIEINEVERSIPGENNILIKVHVSSVNAYEWRHVRDDPFLIRFMAAGLLRPKHMIPGAYLKGTEETISNYTVQKQDK